MRTGRGGNKDDPRAGDGPRVAEIGTFGGEEGYSSSSFRLRRVPAHSRPEPVVRSVRPMTPSGITASGPVNAVPPGVTVVG